MTFEHMVCKSHDYNTILNTSMQFPDKIVYFDKNVLPKHLRLRKIIKHNIKTKYKQRNIALRINTQFNNFDFTNKVRVIQRQSKSTDNPFAEFYHKFTFDNQKLFGKQIQHLFLNKHILNTLAIAPTQSGKTGSMLASCFHMCQHKDTFVPHNHIFIFTAHSSQEWLLQTKKRFPLFMNNNIYHRPQLNSLILNIQNKKNVLLILDEIQIGSKPFQSLFKLFHACNFFDMQSNYDNNIKILSFTATPNSLIQHFQTSWKSSFAHIHMQVPKQYISSQTLLHNHHLIQNKDLCGFQSTDKSFDNKALDNILQFLNFIRIQSSKPMFHIIRTHRGIKHLITLRNFAVVFKHHFPDIQVSFISEPKQSFFDFDSLLQQQPKKHTFIFIIDKLRCAKTICLKHVASLYDRFVLKPSFDSIQQGLIGRTTGYYSHHFPYCFSHLNSLPFLLQLSFSKF